MSIAIVFAIAFMVLVSITLGFPTLPPGITLSKIILDFLGIPEITHSILGFSGETIVNSIINGIVWGFFISLIYGLGRLASKKEVVIVPATNPKSMSAPEVKREVIIVSAPTPKTAPTLIPQQQPTISPPLESRQRKTYPAPLIPTYTFEKLDKDIDTIEGIGRIYGNRLRVLGIKTVGTLLKVGSTRGERHDLARQVGVTPTMMFKWVNQADFFRIRGIGRQYADLLDAAGVKTVMDLSRRNPRNLYEKLKETNMERNLVKRTPPYKIIENWIHRAKGLGYIVN